MNSKKLTHVHVYIIGVVVALIVGLGLYFAVLKPKDEANTALRRDIQGKRDTGVPVDAGNFKIDQKTQADAALVKATERLASKKAELAEKENSRKLPASLAIPIPKSGPDLAHTLPKWLVLPPMVVRQMDAYAHKIAAKHKVQITTQFVAPAPTLDPKAIHTDIYAWNLGPMTVQGPFPNVMAWTRDWNNSPLLTSVDGLKCTLAGRKGVITANANLTVFFFPTGEGVTGPGGAAGGGAAPAAGGPVGVLDAAGAPNGPPGGPPPPPAK